MSRKQKITPPQSADADRLEAEKPVEAGAPEKLAEHEPIGIPTEAEELETADIRTESALAAIAAEEPKSPKKMLLFGGIVLAFAVIGLIATVIFLANTIAGVAGQDKKKDAYEWMITPVVLQDPPTFESPDKLSDSTIITAGIWRLIMNEDTSKYPSDPMNFISVPQSDVEVQIKALFGDVKYTHQAVGDTELYLNYDQEGKCYIFPAVPHVLAYTPEVQKIVKEEKKVILTVGYVPPGLVWEGDVSGNKYRPVADKIMTYTLEENDKGELKLYSVTGSATDDGSFQPDASSVVEEDIGAGSEPAVIPEPESTVPTETSSVESAVPAVE